MRAAPPILIVFVDQSCVGSGVIVKHVIIERALQGSRPGSKPGARGGREPQFSSSRASNRLLRSGAAAAPCLSGSAPQRSATRPIGSRRGHVHTTHKSFNLALARISASTARKLPDARRRRICSRSRRLHGRPFAPPHLYYISAVLLA